MKTGTKIIRLLYSYVFFICSVLWDGNSKIVEPKLIEDGMRMYFEVMQFQPVKINITFSRSEQIKLDEDSPRSYNPIYFILNVFTMAIGNITVGRFVCSYLR